MSVEGSDVSITASTLNIETDTGAALHVQNNSQDEIAPANRATLTVVADNINLKSNAIGISSYSNGKMDISGNLTIDAPTAIDARGYSETNINQNGNGTVVINGDISFETPGPDYNSGDIIDATVNLNLAGENSSWTGKRLQGLSGRKRGYQRPEQCRRPGGNRTQPDPVKRGAVESDRHHRFC